MTDEDLDETVVQKLLNTNSTLLELDVDPVHRDPSVTHGVSDFNARNGAIALVRTDVQAILAEIGSVPLVHAAHSGDDVLSYYIAVRAIIREVGPISCPDVDSLSDALAYYGAVRDARTHGPGSTAQCRVAFLGNEESQRACVSLLLNACSAGGGGGDCSACVRVAADGIVVAPHVPCAFSEALFLLIFDASVPAAACSASVREWVRVSSLRAPGGRCSLCSGDVGPPGSGAWQALCVPCTRASPMQRALDGSAMGASSIYFGPHAATSHCIALSPLVLTEATEKILAAVPSACVEGVLQLAALRAAWTGIYGMNDLTGRMLYTMMRRAGLVYPLGAADDTDDTVIAELPTQTLVPQALPAMEPSIVAALWVGEIAASHTGRCVFQRRFSVRRPGGGLVTWRDGLLHRMLARVGVPGSRFWADGWSNDAHACGRVRARIALERSAPTYLTSVVSSATSDAFDGCGVLQIQIQIQNILVTQVKPATSC